MNEAPPLRYWLPYQLLGTRVPVTYKEWVKDDIASPLFPEKDLFRSLVLVGIFAAVLAFGMREPLSMNFTRGIAIVLGLRGMFQLFPAYRSWVRRTRLRKQQRGWDGPSDKSSHGWREEIGRGPR